MVSQVPKLVLSEKDTDGKTNVILQKPFYILLYNTQPIKRKTLIFAL